MTEGGWADDAIVQDLWAGLLSSSCTDSGDDDSNLIFTNLLGNMTKLQANIIKAVCENAVKYRTTAGLVYAQQLRMTLEEMFDAFGETDIPRLDRELDCLRESGLLDMRGGINPDVENPGTAVVTPSSLALHMYVRCQGSRKSPVEFFGLAIERTQENPTTP